jgi:hypothetical protein
MDIRRSTRLPKLTRKCPTWQVMLQNRKSMELTVNLTSCGSYDFQSDATRYILPTMVGKFLPLLVERATPRNASYSSAWTWPGSWKNSSGGAWLSSIRVLIRSVNSVNECNPISLFRLVCGGLTFNHVLVISRSSRLPLGVPTARSRRRVRIMSSRHALHRLGCPYDTMAFTKSSRELRPSKSRKMALVRIGTCNLVP